MTQSLRLTRRKIAFVDPMFVPEAIVKCRMNLNVIAIANVAAVLDSAGWSGWGLSQEAWMGVALALVVALAWLLALREREGVFLAVLLWALVGIGVRFPNSGFVTLATWGAALLVGLALAAALLIVGMLLTVALLGAVVLAAQDPAETKKDAP